MSQKSFTQLFRRWVARGSRATARPTARLRLEEVEHRLVPATLPVVSVASTGVVTNTGTGFAPQVVADPTNPNTLAMVVAQQNGILAQISFDGGVSWTKLRDTNSAYPNDVPASFAGDTSRGMLLDPSISSQQGTIPAYLRGYTNASSPTIAFTRSKSVYISYVESNATMTSGALVVERFDIDRTGASFTQYDLDRARDWDNDPTTPATERFDQANGGNNRTAVLYQWVDDGVTVNRPLNPYIAVDTNLDTFTDPASADTATDPFVSGGGGDTIFVAWNTQTSAPTVVSDGGGYFPGFYSDITYNPNAVMLAVGRVDPLALIDRPDPNQPVDPVTNPRQAAFLFSTPVPVNDSAALATGVSSAGLPAGGHFLYGADSGTGGAAPTVSFTPATLRLDGAGNPFVTPGQMSVVWSTTGSQIAQSTVTLGSGPGSASYLFRSNDVPTGTVINPFGGGSLGTSTSIPDAFPPPTSPPPPPNAPDIPGIIEYDLPVDLNPFTPAQGGFFDALTDLDVQVAITTNRLQDYRIQLISPGGQVVNLVNNRSNPVDGSDIVSPSGVTHGLTGNDLGVSAGIVRSNATNGGQLGNPVGTVFSQEAGRHVEDPTNPANYIGSYRPETGSLDQFYGLDASSLNSIAGANWKLRITDVRADRLAQGELTPIRRLEYWSLTFTSQLDNSATGVRAGADRFVTSNAASSPVGDTTRPRVGTAAFGAAQTFPTVDAASPTFGIGPGVAVAYDNTLGRFSPYGGRMYVAYAAPSGATTVGGQPDTNIYLVSSDDNGATWSRRVQVDGTSAADNTSEGRRSQFQPSVAVDPATGTVVVSWYDARTDANNSRVATFVATSIDGGATFSPAQSVNPEKTAIDAATRTTVNLEPVPTNFSGFTTFNAGAFQFGGPGIRQSVLSNNGVIRAFWAGNADAAGSAVYMAKALSAAGPRVIASDMGAVSELSVDTNSAGTQLQTGQIRFRDEDDVASTITYRDATNAVVTSSAYNNTFAPDGTRRIDGFRVVFDRPIYFGTQDSASVAIADPTGEGFDPTDVTVRFRGTAGNLSTDSQGALVPVARVVPIGGTVIGGFVFATAFYVQFSTPQTAVGTYSYAVSPNLSDRVRSQQGASFGASDTPTRFITGNELNRQVQTTVQSTIVIPPTINADTGLATTVQNLQVGLSLTYPVRSDLTVSLVAPDGTTVVLFSGLGGGNLRNARFSPAGFDGKTLAGAWTLRVSGITALNATLASAIDSWRLEVLDAAGGTPVTVTALGNGLDQDADATQREQLNDTYSAPGSAAGTPFVGPYNPATQPLILPGPHVTQTYPAGQAAAVTQAIQTSTGTIDVVLDREVDAAALVQDGIAAVASVTGPNGPVSLTGASIGLAQSNIVNGGVKVFTINFPSATPVAPGSYAVVLSNQVFVTDGTVLNKTTNAVLVRFDRDVNPASFTAANVLRITGPAGDIPLTGVTVTAVGEDRQALAAGAVAARLFRVQFPTQQISGAYSVEFGSNPAVADPALAAVRGADRPQFVTTVPAGTTANSLTFTLSSGALLPTDQFRVTGPTGVLTGGVLTVNGNNSYTITFAAALPVGQYVVDLPAAAARNIRVAGSGLPVDSNFNAGLDLLTGRAVSGTGTTLVNYPSTSNPVPIPAAASATTPSVTDLTLTINDDFVITQDAVNRIGVLLNIRYPNVYDLDVQLVPPATTGINPILLYSGLDDRPANAGANAQGGANFVNTPLVDRVGDPLHYPSILDGTAPFTPANNVFGYTPEQPLSVLADPNNPVSARGTWTLRVTNRGTTAFTAAQAQITGFQLSFPRAAIGSGLGERSADRFSAGFRVYTLDPTNPLSSTAWTQVGPASANEGAGAGRVTAIAVDPSDPSGNTVYVAGASGGVWKTTNFLTSDVDGPHYVPLTDFGPTTSLNIQSLAVFPRNADTTQTIVYALTGEGNTAGLSAAGLTGRGRTATGVGVIRSLDGGRTWAVLDSINNASSDPNAVPGTVGKVSDPGRDRTFAGASGFKIVVDPNPGPDGGVIVYMAVSGSAAQAGLWRSRDGGLTWTRIQAGQATDVVLAVGSANTTDPITQQVVTTGNLQRLYAAFRSPVAGTDAAAGVYYTDSAPSSSGLISMTGLGGLPSVRDFTTGFTAGGNTVSVQNTPSPNTGLGRIAIAAPALTSDPVRNSFYRDWLYAVVVTPAGAVSGLYQTKDAGLNWTQVQVPVYVPANTAGRGFATNDETAPDYDLFSSGLLGEGNYDVSLTVDPANPAVVYLGGLGGQGRLAPVGGSIRLDLTTIKDSQSFVNHNNSDPAGGYQNLTVGGLVPRPVPGQTPDPNNIGSGKVLLPGSQTATYGSDFLNLSRDPSLPFSTNSTVRTVRVQALVNDGSDVSYQPFNAVLGVGALRAGKASNERELASAVHTVFPLFDPTTGQTRLIYGTDQGVFTGVDAGDGSLNTAVGFDRLITGSRNGDLAITQFYSGAVQTSQLAADVAGALFYGMAQDNGFLVSDPRALATGNTDWRGPEGDGADVEVDQTGTGTAYQYRSPTNDGGSTGPLHPGSDNNVTALPSDFFRVFPAGYDQEFSGGIGRTFGLLQLNNGVQDNPATGAGQYPATGGFPFAVNPVNPNVLVIASGVGRVFRTLNQGVNWVPIGEPGQFDGTGPGAQAFGAVDPAASGLTNNFIYNGTAGGHIYVTQTGGGTATNSWLDISAGLDGSAVRKIVPNPAAGSKELYAVTNRGVFYKADGTTTAPWVDVTSNLFSVTRSAYGDTSDQVVALPATGRALDALAVDWRFETAATPTAAAQPPQLYVAGVGGVFKSSDGGATWRLFPEMTADSAPATGGYLPNVEVTDLDLSIGDLNATSGRYQAGGENLLLATTYGRSSYAIRLSNALPPVTFVKGPAVSAVINPNPAGGPSASLQVQFTGPVDPATLVPANFRLQRLNAAGNPVAGGDVPILAVAAAGVANRYTVTFQTQNTAGVPTNYRLTVGASADGVPSITDPAGNRMDQDGDTTNGEAVVDQYITTVVLNGQSNNLTVVAYPPALTAGVAGAVRIEERDSNGAVLTTANGPLTLTSTGPGAVQYLDASGNPVTTVNLVNGVATFQVRFTTAGAYSITAAAGGGVNPTSFATTVTAGVANSVVLSPVNSTAVAGGSVGFVLGFNDAFGNPAAYNGTVAVTYGGAAVGAASPPFVNVNTAAGQNAFTVVTQQSGTATVTVFAPSPTGGPALVSNTAAIAVAAGTANRVVVTPVGSGSYVIGTPVSVTVRVVDANGNTVGDTGNLVVSTGDPAAVITPAPAQVANGTGTFTVTFSAAGTYTIGVTDPAGATGFSAPVTITTVAPRPTPTQTLSGTFAAATGANGDPVVRVFNSGGGQVAALTPFPAGYGGEVDDGSPGFTGGIRVAVADVTGDGVPDYVVGTGPTITATVQVIDGTTNRAVLTLRPFEDFKGGVFVSTGDVDGDGLADIVVTPDEGGGPRVSIYKGGNFTRIANFFGINDPNFRGGARAALGDVNGDGFADLVVSAGFGGGPRISIYDGAALAQGVQLNVIGDFFMFEDTLRNGAYVAVGDVNGDGLADIIGGAGPGGGPRVLVLDSNTLLQRGSGAALAAPLFNAFLGDPDNRGGVRVAAKNLNGDNNADILVGSGDGGGSRVEAYSGRDFSLLQSFDLVPGYTGGVFVG